MAGSSRKVIYAALTANALIALTKFAAALITGSSAMFSEGIHSVVDTGNQILLLYGLHRSDRPADARFPFGYGKEVYFWSFIVAILIFAVGAGISLYEGVHRLLNPAPLENVTVNYIVLALAILFEGAGWFLAMREFSRAKGKWGYIEAVRRAKDPSTFVVLFEDSAAILGLAVAFVAILLGQLTGIHYFDGAASIVIGFILGGTATWLAFETKGLLIGESANQRVIDGIRALVATFPEVVRVNEVLTMHMGPNFILANISVEFQDATTVPAMEGAVARIDKAIKQAFPRVKRVFIEAETMGSASPAGVPADNP